MQLGPIQTAFVEALECGQYVQGKDKLKTACQNDRTGCTNYAHCCLGVLTEVVIKLKPDDPEFQMMSSSLEHFLYLPRSVMSAVKMHNEYGTFSIEAVPEELRSLIPEAARNHSELGLAVCNDKGMPFTDIVKLIRGCPQLFFSESV